MQFASVAAAAEQRYFIVGDSYSDTGNYAARHSQVSTATDNAHSNKTARSTDTLWVNQLFSGETILPAWTLPIDKPPPADVVVINYAVARATTGYELTKQVDGWFFRSYSPYGMQWQFENSHRRFSFTPADTLIIWGGVNDLVWAVELARLSFPHRFIEELRTPMPRGGIDALVDQAANNTMILVERAVKFGVGRIIVITTGAETMAPLQDKASSKLYNTAVKALEQQLAARIKNAAQSWPENRISHLDFTPHLNASVEKARLTMDRSCVDQQSVCTNPEQFFYWDWVHPTATGHCLIAQILHEHLADPSIAPVRCTTPRASADATAD